MTGMLWDYFAVVGVVAHVIAAMLAALYVFCEYNADVLDDILRERQRHT